MKEEMTEERQTEIMQTLERFIVDDCSGCAYDEPDAHSCSVEADSSGVCQVCGALVYMSPAYCDAYGCDRPERRKRYDSWSDTFVDIDD